MEQAFFNVLGVNVSATNMTDAVNIIMDWVNNNEKRFVIARDVGGIVRCQADKNFKALHEKSGLNVPDGAPLVWVGKLYGFAETDRVFGPELMLKVCKKSIEYGYTHFIYGGKPGLADELRNNLCEWFPGLQIVGTYTPPFRPLNEDEEQELISIINQLKPDIFWVCIGSPKQEFFSDQYLYKLDTKVMICVGAAIDFHTGRLVDAPDWVKKIGMQWFHRLCQEPKRLWKKYLINNSTFLILISWQILKDFLSLKTPRTWFKST